MKYLLIILLSVTCGYGVNLKNSIKPLKVSQSTLNQAVLSKINWDEIRALVEKEIKDLRAGFVQVDVTDYALAILKNVGEFISQSGLDPMGLEDQDISLFPGSLDITNGTLEDLSTITAANNVIAKYTHDTGILELTLPLGFDALLIKYNYKVKILLLSISGTISAKVSDLKLNLHLGFNFSECHAFVDRIDVKNSGSIDIDFTGLGLLDWVIDVMTKALTTLFHEIILSVINAIIYDPVGSVVDEINSAIDSFLHPNSTSILISY